MNLQFTSWDNQYWNIIREEIDNKEYPLQELQILWQDRANQPIEGEFIEFAKSIGIHPTLIKFGCSFHRLSSNSKGAFLFEQLKNTNSIRHMRLQCDYIDSNTVHAFDQMLINNQTLVSLDMLLYSDPGYSGWRPDEDDQ